MAQPIRWSPRAASNFEDICNYIALDSPYYASLFAKKVNVVIKAFPNFPRPDELCRNMEMKIYVKRSMKITGLFIEQRKKS